MGAVSDYLSFGSMHRLHLIFTAVCIAIIGTQFLLYKNYIQVEHIAYITMYIPVLSHILGGVIFGAGMMLASGCPTQHCFNLGQGQLKGLLVIPIVAISAQITSTGILAQPRLWLENLWRIPYININSIYIHAGLIFGIVLFCSYMFFLIYKKQPRLKLILINGCMAGCIVVAMWYIAGYLAFVEQDANTLDYAYIGNSGRTIQSLSMILPYMQFFDWLLYSSDELRILNASIMLMFGLVIGGGIMHIIQQRKKFAQYKLTFTLYNCLQSVQSFKTVKDFVQVFFGALFMGVGGVMALGCSIGQGLSGLSVLSFASLVTVISMFVGAKIAYKYML